MYENALGPAYFKLLDQGLYTDLDIDFNGEFVIDNGLTIPYQILIINSCLLGFNPFNECLRCSQPRIMVFVGLIYLRALVFEVGHVTLNHSHFIYNGNII